MPAAAKNSAAVRPSCIVLVTSSENARGTAMVLRSVTCYGDDVDGARSAAAAYSEDGDGSSTYGVKRVYDSRAVRILALSAELRSNPSKYEEIVAKMVAVYAE